MNCGTSMFPYEEFLRPITIKNILILILLWSTTVFNYYCTTFFIGSSPGNIFYNTISMQISDLSAIILSGFLLRFTDIEKSLTLFYLISASASMFFFLPENKMPENGIV